MEAVITAAQRLARLVRSGEAWSPPPCADGISPTRPPLLVKAGCIAGGQGRLGLSVIKVARDHLGTWRDDSFRTVPYRQA